MRKYLIAGLAVALLLGGALFALLRPWHCPVNRAAFERIKEGMTRAEVEKILGGPAGDYRTDQEREEGMGGVNPIGPNMITPFTVVLPLISHLVWPAAPSPRPQVSGPWKGVGCHL